MGGGWRVGGGVREIILDLKKQEKQLRLELKKVEVRLAKMFIIFT